MKHHCNLIKDLLPLYHDEVCSRESKDAVEEHLAECEACQKYYDVMNASDVVEEITFDAERERKKHALIKRMKWGMIIVGIIIAIAILVILAPFIVVIVGLSAGMFFTRPEVDDSIANYNQYFGEYATEHYSDKLGMDDSIFPAEIADEMDVLDFTMVYYNPFDPQYLSYMVVSYENEAYDREMERLMKYGVEQYSGYYGATGFGEEYDLVAMNADDYQGFVYALSDGEDTIIYVELLFCNYFYDLDYKEYIPDEYLPLGFDATLGNEYSKQRLAESS